MVELLLIPDSGLQCRVQGLAILKHDEEPPGTHKRRGRADTVHDLPLEGILDREVEPVFQAVLERLLGAVGVERLDNPRTPAVGSPDVLDELFDPFIELDRVRVLGGQSARGQDGDF